MPVLREQLLLKNQGLLTSNLPKLAADIVSDKSTCGKLAIVNGSFEIKKNGMSY